MKTFRNRINIRMRKNTVPILGQKYALSVLYFCLPNFRHLHPPSYLRLVFLVCSESFDWVQQDIFEVILLNRCSVEEGKSERGNFKQPKQCFESSHVLRRMTD